MSETDWGFGDDNTTPTAMNAASLSEGCGLCGAKGIHACMGKMPDPWTPEKIAEFDAVLSEYESEPAGQGSATSGEALSDTELADPVFVRAYIEGCNDSFNAAMAEVRKLRAALVASAEQSSSDGGGNAPVGKVIANDPVHGWHMEALKPWDEIGEGTLLYAAPVAERAAAPASVPEGFVLVPDAQNMTDKQAEAIAAMANCCGGIAFDIYRVALDAAPEVARPAAQGECAAPSEKPASLNELLADMKDGK